MARYGKVLLQRLTFQYCDRMGSSQGLREYVDQLLPKFQQANPLIQTTVVLKRNRFPLVKAEYALLPNSAAHLKQQLDSQTNSLRQQRPPGTSSSSSSSSSSRAKQSEPRLTSNVVGLKHRSADEVQQVVWWLSQSQNRPKTRGIPTKHIASKQPSIQGVWTASTFM